jgi:C-terminal processing protease CtpA/Prc
MTTQRSPATLDAATRAEVIDALLTKLDSYYVFPDSAREMAEAIRRRAERGEYEALDGGEAFAGALTAHLQEVSRDKHLRVRYSAEVQPLRGDDDLDSAARREEFRRASELRNHGFEKVERLPGNVGLLDLRGFTPAEIAGDLAVAAMALLANTSALIVDLRRNGGGSPSGVALLCSYLVDAEPVHLNSFYWRDGDRTHQWWTLPYVPGRRYLDRPVYVLTSGRTFSGAEEFTYNLKNLQRATIVGETTGGGAHPGGVYQLTPHFEAFIPTGRPINPITGANWEGTGVEPDVAVPQEDALNTAHTLALRAVLERIGEEPTGPLKALREEAQAALAELGG